MTQTESIQWDRMLARSRSPLAWYDEHDPCDNRHPEQQHARVRHRREDQREADEVATRHDPQVDRPVHDVGVVTWPEYAMTARCVWVYHEFGGSWLVGYYDPDGNWRGDGTYPTRETAAARVHWLNGGG